MAIFDEKTGERLDGPGAKKAAPAKDSEPKPEDTKPAKSSPKKG